jgi:hypothetical protein
MNGQRGSIKGKILELCSEDDYGSWELWWAITSEYKNVAGQDLQLDFIDAIENLIRDGKIVAKTRTGGPKFLFATFSREQLNEEIKSAVRPDPETFYWFGSAK